MTSNLPGIPGWLAREPRNLPVSISLSTGTANKYHFACLFDMGSGIPTQVLMTCMYSTSSASKFPSVGSYNNKRFICLRALWVRNMEATS